MSQRITEPDLILPSLYLMSLNNGTITTTELKDKLRLIMKPEGEDLNILSKRNDDKFSQKVRNLRAHSTFEKLGYAEYIDASRNGRVEITEKGRLHLQTNKDILNYLLINDFKYSDLKENLAKIESNHTLRKIEVFDENISIQEGIKKITETAIYERSQKLRKFAITRFSENNKICCKCCSFNFEDFYGEIGKGFIEIHHVKPIFKFAEEDLNSTLERAIYNLIPVCSNCHRIIHRNWKKPLEIKDIISSINNQRMNNSK